MPLSRNLKATVIISVAIATLSAGCSKSDDNDPDPDPEPTTSILLRNDATLGSILTDKDNRTLYYFSNDAGGTNTCTGGCELVWPPVLTSSFIASKIGAGLSAADFDSLTTASGKKQLTYKTWPLYYYAPVVGGTNVPEPAGQTGGENVDGIWFVAKPDYTVMLVNAQLVGHDGLNYTSGYTPGDGKTIYFTDAKGVTLYTFKNDRFNKNNFTAADFSNNGVWPIYENSQVVVPSTLDKTLFATTTVFGKTQLTYKGWPLYYFGQDGRIRGSNKGVSFPVPGGIWPVPVKDLATAAQ